MIRAPRRWDEDSHKSRAEGHYPRCGSPHEKPRILGILVGNRLRKCFRIKIFCQRVIAENSTAVLGSIVLCRADAISEFRKNL
jgi:hypothetical protein